MRSRWLLFAVCALVAALLLAHGVDASGADWDDEEFDAPQQKANRAAGKVFDEVDKEAEKAAARIRLEERRHAKFKNYPPLFELRYEGIGLIIVTLWFVNWIVGDGKNRKLALDFEDAFCGDDGVFKAQFASVGDMPKKVAPRNGSVLSKESSDEYKIWCSGRRFCEGAMITLKLKPRHDLYSAATAFQGRSLPDYCVIEVNMNDECVQPGSVFAFGPKELIANLEEADGEKDLKKLTQAFVPKREHGQRVTHKDVTVKAESLELANDITFTPEVMKVIGESTWAKNGKASLVCVYNSDEAAPKFGSLPHPKTLKFQFTMPSDGSQIKSAMGECMNLVPALIDVVGRVQLTPGQREKALNARKKREEEDFKADLKANQRKTAREIQDEKLAKMTPAEKEAWKKKQEKKQARKTAGKMVMKR